LVSWGGPSFPIKYGKFHSQCHVCEYRENNTYEGYEGYDIGDNGSRREFIA
jgi:hypothetical protein